LTLNLLCLPFGYLKGIYISIQVLRNNKIRGTKLSKILWFICFLFLGIFILLLNICVDLVVFVIHLYQQDIKHRKEPRSDKKLSHTSYNLLQVTIEKEREKGFQVTKYFDILSGLNKKLHVQKLFENAFYGQSIDGTINHEFKQCIKKITDYTQIKNILINSRVVHEDEYYIATKLLKSILKELKINSRLTLLIESWHRYSRISTLKNSKVDSLDKYQLYLEKVFDINLSKLHETMKEIFDATHLQNSELFNKERKLQSMKTFKKVNKQSTISQLRINKSKPVKL
jgi:hypothetical protein